MRLLELEIAKTRGIKQLILKPGGDNLVIYGPNGSGKSAVVDAIDFLLTGRISRLAGRGSKKLSLKAHGPHVDHKPGEAFVRGVFELPGYGKPVELRRRFSAPSALESPPAARAALAPILVIAAKGQHVLSRKQILQYVAVEPNERAKEVQMLLELTEVEEIRKALTNAANTARREEKQIALDERQAESTVAQTLALKEYSASAVVASVNKLRAVLKGNPLESVLAENVKEGLSPRGPGAPAGPSKSDVEKASQALSASLEKDRSRITRLNRTLRDEGEKLIQDEHATKELRKLKLYELGVSLLEPDGVCPLCGTAWDPGALREHLEKHIRTASEIAARQKQIEATAREMATVLSGVVVSLNQLLEKARALDHKESVPVLEEWVRELQSWSQTLIECPVKGTVIAVRDDSKAEAFLMPPSWEDHQAAILQMADQKGVSKSPEQEAWDVLTRLEENLRHHARAAGKGKRAIYVAEAAEISRTTFEQARDYVLESLYKSIEDRFSELYRSIHKDDEAGFGASLQPEGPALNFDVDFYGRGRFPPLAVHSEGHQDTMGIALYLALAERLTTGSIDLTILDDVVMSVDADHRRQFCEVLKEKLPKRQFIITTHDRMWARQLRSGGIATRANSSEFTRWTIEEGPLVGTEKEMWTKIDSFLAENDVPRAAHTLRRGSEEFFEEVCSRLQAKVTYKTDESWELGDFSPAAYSRYKKLLASARAAAKSHGDNEAESQLAELETVAAQVYNQSQIEQWGINPNVHYSRWASFTPGDFRPVVDAWRSLLELFACAKCESTLVVTFDDKKKANAMRCGCASVSWNLLRR